MQAARWRLADWLSYFACRLRGHKWYVPLNWAAVPGNRAADLRQSIWERLAVSQLDADPAERHEQLHRFDVDLMELAQLANENWGHAPRPEPGPTPVFGFNVVPLPKGMVLPDGVVGFVAPPDWDGDCREVTVVKRGQS